MRPRGGVLKHRVAHALLRAASPLVGTLGSGVELRRRSDESERGTRRRVRHALLRDPASCSGPAPRGGVHYSWGRSVLGWSSGGVQMSLNAARVARAPRIIVTILRGPASCTWTCSAWRSSFASSAPTRGDARFRGGAQGAFR